MKELSVAVFSACLLFASAAFAGQTAPLPLPVSWAALAIDQAVASGAANSKPDFSAGIEARKSYGIAAAEIVGFDFLLNRFDHAHFGCCEFDVGTRSIRRNLRSSWVIDRDPFLVNQLGHPYQGSTYHGFARASGLDFWHGLGYTFAGSAFWEIAGETTPPSFNDQINTGIGGAFLGEALFRMASLVLERGGEMSPLWRELAAAAISPPLGFNRLAFGERFRLVFPSRDPVYFTRLQVGFSGSPRDESGISTTKLKRNEALADFFIDYGLPGKGDYRYTRAFDYFSFQATMSSANGFENAMTRGLLKGKEYTVGGNYRGVWGLYGSHDYIAPQTFRVSSTSVSLGTTAQWWLSRSTALIGTVMGGVGYTAAGTIRSSLDREFNYGVAPQALVALRFIFGDTAAIDLTGRAYYISRVAAADRGGEENIGRLDAALTWRVHKQHGITIKYLGNRRDASYPDIAERIQRRQTIGIFYTFLGHDRFGAVDLPRD